MLLTYEFQRGDWEVLKNGEEVTCTKKPNHRNIYLDYEGELSRNRGKVAIVWKGFYDEKKYTLSEKIRISLENLTLIVK